ncbi:MAG: hypothetical protein EXS18_06045 [Verrucomicrobiae bacterium]|nr:hypothetical protein [Verrucomicrobiae bacterium]
MNATKILWIYIVLLIAGGLVGFFKGKSKISLIMSVSFAAALILCALHVGPFNLEISIWILVALLVVFGIRLIKTKKFMPSGLMLILTVLALALPHLVK